MFSPLVPSTNLIEDEPMISAKRRHPDQNIDSSDSVQISTCHLCSKKFQSNEYLQLHLLNKHPLSQRTPSSAKKIKLDSNDSPSTDVHPPSKSSSSTISAVVDTYFAAKMADRVSCDICHKVNLPHPSSLLVLIDGRCSKCAINTS